MVEKIKNMDILSKLILGLAIVLSILLIMDGIKYYRFRVKSSTYNIVLLGDNPTIVYQNDQYVESGYVAKDYNNQEKNNLVKVTNNINSSVVGKYEVVYEINNFFKKNKVIREVNVVENPLEDVEFSLKGDSVVNIERNSKYIESGYNIVSDKGDFTTNVSIKNDVDITKIGTYEVIYTLKIGNKEKNLKRIVNVVGNKCTAVVDNTEWTKENVIISVDSHIKDFDYFINPNNVKVYDEYFEFIVDKNGIYEFHLVDTYGVDELIKVDVNNIDRESPKGTCSSIISGNKTAYQISANDESGILEYVHNGISYGINSFVTDVIEEEGNVVIYDLAGNSTEISCLADYEYLGPNNSYLYKYESPTLKYWIENASTNYKTTHIWVKDSYSQMKVGIPAKIGTLNTARAILNKEIKNNGYENKGMVAINASGIVGGGFGKQFLNMKPSWIGTTAIPLVINDGKIIRDSTLQELPDVSHITYGMSKNGYLTYYRYRTGDNLTHNKEIKEKILNDGIRYTFGFYPVLVWNSQPNSTNQNHDIRQGICQINRNNFIIITNTNGTNNRGAGLSFSDMANYMVKLNCKLGLNLDGGGSVNFYYKGNDSNIYNIRSSNRGLVDLLYFVEK